VPVSGKMRVLPVFLPERELPAGRGVTMVEPGGNKRLVSLCAPHARREGFAAPPHSEREEYGGDWLPAA
jgi:hypothetical protein